MALTDVGSSLSRHSALVRSVRVTASQGLNSVGTTSEKAQQVQYCRRVLGPGTVHCTGILAGGFAVGFCFVIERVVYEYSGTVLSTHLSSTHLQSTILISSSVVVVQVPSCCASSKRQLLRMHSCQDDDAEACSVARPTPLGTTTLRKLIAEVFSGKVGGGTMKREEEDDTTSSFVVMALLPIAWTPPSASRTHFHRSIIGG